MWSELLKYYKICGFLGDFVAVAVFAYDLENCVAVAFGFGESYVRDLEELLLGLRKVGGEIIKGLVAQNVKGGGGETFRLFFHNPRPNSLRETYSGGIAARGLC